MRRALKGLGWALLALLLLLVALCGWLLGSESGSRWALGQVPGLAVQGFAGRLGGDWQAERLVWRQGERRVEVESPRLAWSPACLLHGRVCIERLSTGDIEIRLPTSPDSGEPGPPSLPELSLPVEIQIEHLSTGRIRYNGTELLEQVRLGALWTSEGLKIETLSLQRDDLSLTAQGRLQTAGDWPLALAVTLRLQVPGREALNLALQVDGRLRQTLDLQATSSGLLEARLQGQLRPLAEHLPLQVRLSAVRLRATPTLPEPLVLHDLVLQAEGDLAEGYRVEGQARLQGDAPIALRLDGQIGTDGVRALRLALAADDQRWVRLAGSVDWAERLQADLALEWRDFPWQQLYPDLALPVTLQRLTAELQYDDGSYLGHFEAGLRGPAGDFSLASPVSGNLESLHLPSLSLVAGQGRVEGSLGLDFADALAWTARLQLSELDPAYWLASLPGRLEGTLESRGRLNEGNLQASADLALSGRLRGQPAVLRAEAAGEGEQWRVPALSLRLGDNRVEGQGRWGETLEGALRLELPRLAQLWPGLSGQVQGDLSLGGRPQAPTAELQLEGGGLAYRDSRLQRLELEASLDDQQRARLQLDAGGLTQGELTVSRLRLQGQGTREAHRAQLQLEGEPLDLSLSLQGGLQGEDWRGQLLTAQIDGFDQRWSLRRPADLARLADGRLLLSAHCWVSDPASLCAEDQRLLPEPQLRYHLRDFPLQRLADLAPVELQWQGSLLADIEVDLPDSGPRGQILVEAGPGTLRLREEERWLDFPYQTLRLDSQLRPELARGDLRFAGGELGDLELQARVDPRGETKPLDGSFVLQGFDLTVLRPFLPQVGELEGSLAGSGTLSGTLQRPLIQGSLRLSDGLVAGEALPTRLEDLNLELAIDGRQLAIDGAWRSGAQGRGQLEGTLAWEQGLSLDLDVDGQDLPVVVEPYAELDVSPDLNLSLQDGRLAVSGRVAVPRGDIQIRQLPPSTVRVSPDAVIVGETTEEAPPLQVAMDVDVEVGQERLRFSGFGLTADLAGYLHVGDNLDARGELTLKNGRYRAYGQRLAIRRARLLFTGPLSQPFLDIEAVRRIEEDDVTAGLRITGSTESPQVEVFSEPAMSQQQALSYLVLGRAPGADSGDSNLLAQAALGLGLAGTSSFTGAVAERLGIEDFQLDTEGSGADTSVVASGNLTDRLSLRYGVGVFEPGNTLSLRYKLTRRLFLEAASGIASSLDLFYRRDF